MATGVLTSIDFFSIKLSIKTNYFPWLIYWRQPKEEYLNTILLEQLQVKIWFVFDTDCGH